jgi:hypothetical protein
VIPAAPDGRSFFEGGEPIFPELLTGILADYKVVDNKFHIAGQSNGGIRAFHVAPCILDISGPSPACRTISTPASVGAPAKMCINMHVGERDAGWKEERQQQAAQFRAQGESVRITAEKGQSHRLDIFSGDGAARLFRQFEEAHPGCSE